MLVIKRIGLLAEALILGYGLLLFTSLRGLLPDYHYLTYTPERYQKMLIISKKEILKQQSIVNKQQSKQFFRTSFANLVSNQMVPYWLGTRWNFYGTSERPGRGTIACGYFVTTVLRDAGYPIERIKLACMASEEMIKKLCSQENIERYSKVDLNDFVDNLPQPKSQLYVVGLDHHTGFLAAMKGKWFFVHSSGRFPFCVVQEEARHSVVLRKSKYRVVGKLSDDETFIKKWLEALEA